MSNAESNSGQRQEQLPDLYQLLGLMPLESNAIKIQRALLAMQNKAEAAQKNDPKFAQRAAKIVAVGKKNLLEPDRKSAYDRVWSKVFGTERRSAATGTQAENVDESAIESKTPELEWDLEELNSCLPTEDPCKAFDLGGFLQFSANLPESNPTADYDKLQSFLGGSATATIAGPISISAAALMPEYAQRHDVPYQTKANETFLAPTPSRAPLQVPPGGFARQIRRKRSRAILMSVGGVVVSLAIVSGAVVFWALNNKPALKLTHQLAQAAKRNDAKPNVSNDLIASPTPAVPQGSGLPRVTGLDDLASASNTMTESRAANPIAMNPTPSMPDAVSTPAPTTLAPTTPPVPTTTEPVPPPTPEPTPEPTDEPTPEPAAEPVITAAEKSSWSKAMKELLKTLGSQNFARAKEQLLESEPFARMQLQKEQYQRIATVAQLAEEYHGFLVDAIAGLEASETIKIGSSLEASFVEGSQSGVTFKIRGRLHTFRLTELQVGVSNAIVDLKMDIAHPRSLARKAAFALVHPKTNDAALKRAREQMAEAAGAGAVEADMTTVFDDDYTLKK